MSERHRYFKVLRLTKAIGKLVLKSKGRLLTEDKILQRLEICKPCANFTGTYCLLCDCNCNKNKKYLNKLAYPTEQCPDIPPRWLNFV